MLTDYTNISRAEKILIVLYEMSGGVKKSLKYEDIVVASFKRFKDDFHLRGYEAYPDSGDLIHKPLYDFRKRGLVEANNKVFSLTERGISYAEQLLCLTKGQNLETSGRLSRFTEKEIARIEITEGFKLFINDEKSKITDTDFYSFFGVTPRTPKNDFLGRIETVESAVKELSEQKNISSPRARIVEYHNFLSEKFEGIISYFRSK